MEFPDRVIYSYAFTTVTMIQIAFLQNPLICIIIYVRVSLYSMIWSRWWKKIRSADASTNFFLLALVSCPEYCILLHIVEYINILQAWALRGWGIPWTGNPVSPFCTSTVVESPLLRRENFWSRSDGITWWLLLCPTKLSPMPNCFSTRPLLLQILHLICSSC